MKRFGVPVCLLICFMLSCAPVWVKSGASEQDLVRERDILECRKMASEIAGDYPSGSKATVTEKSANIAVWRGNFDLCMQSKGYKKN